MNEDQRSNIKAAVETLSETLFTAWSFFHVLSGLHEGAKAHPAAVRRFGWYFEQTWRATFDGLFSKLGTFMDTTKSTQSLPNLANMIRRYGDASLSGLLPEVETALSSKAGPLAKLRAWRHEVVAHRTPSVKNDAFYQSNRLKLPEIEEALLQLEGLLNHLSWNLLGLHNDTRTGSAALADEAAALLELIASAMPDERPHEPGATTAT